MLPRANRDNAIAAAAQLAFVHVGRSDFASNATGRSISVALAPLFGIRWSKKIIGAIKSHLVNQMLKHLRNSPFPRADCDRVADLSKDSFFTPKEARPEWEEWHAIVDRYRLDRRHTWPILTDAVSQPISEWDRSPFGLSALDSGDVEHLIASFDDRPAVRDFWRAALLPVATSPSADPFSSPPRTLPPSRPGRPPGDAIWSLIASQPGRRLTIPGCACPKTSERRDRRRALKPFAHRDRPRREPIALPKTGRMRTRSNRFAALARPFRRP